MAAGLQGYDASVTPFSKARASAVRATANFASMGATSNGCVVYLNNVRSVARASWAASSAYTSPAPRCGLGVTASYTASSAATCDFPLWRPTMHAASP
jgi:hypothetical protein